MSKYSQILICFGLLLLTCVVIGLGLKWSNFWLLIIGSGLSILSIVHLIYVICLCFKLVPSIDFIQLIAFGNCVVVLTAISFVVLTWLFGLRDDRYITYKGDKLHLYNDCATLTNSKHIQPVSTLEGFFYGNFKDCEVCVKHEKDIIAENKKKREDEFEREIRAEREEHREEMLTYFKQAIKDLEKCDDPDVIDDYYDDFCMMGADISDLIQEYGDEDDFITNPSNR